jgi:hypothetical protein
MTDPLLIVPRSNSTVFQYRLRKIGKETTPALDFAEMRIDRRAFDSMMHAPIFFKILDSVLIEDAMLLPVPAVDPWNRPRLTSSKNQDPV